MKHIFNLDKGSLIFRLSDRLGIDSKGGMMMRVSDHLSMNLDSRDINITTKWEKDDGRLDSLPYKKR